MSVAKQKELVVVLTDDSDARHVTAVVPVPVTPGTVTVVLGAQWGDEGKGKLIDFLIGHNKVDVIARCQVGNFYERVQSLLFPASWA